MRKIKDNEIVAQCLAWRSPETRTNEQYLLASQIIVLNGNCEDEDGLTRYLQYK